MPTRYIKESICTSDTLAKLSAEAERLFWRLVVLADDFGRYDARPSIIRGKGFSAMLDKVNEKQIAAWLKELQNAGLIITYQIGDKPYLEIITMTQHNHPRAMRSKYPDPPDAQSHTPVCNCVQPQTNATESESESESESKRKPKQPKKEPDLPTQVLTFLQAGGKLPKGNLANGTPKAKKAIELITQTVKDSPESLELWRKVVEAYCLVWSPYSYTIMLNYYSQNKIPGAQNGKPNTTPRLTIANAPKSKADIEYEQAAPPTEHPFR